MASPAFAHAVVVDDEVDVELHQPAFVLLLADAVGLETGECAPSSAHHVGDAHVTSVLRRPSDRQNRAASR